MNGMDGGRETGGCQLGQEMCHLCKGTRGRMDAWLTWDIVFVIA